MIRYNEKNMTFHLSCGSFSYVLAVRDGRLLNLYYGEPLSPETDLSYLFSSYYNVSSFEQIEQNLPLELPSVGTGWYGDPAIQAIGPDGNNITKLRYRDHKVLPHKEPLPGLPSAGTGKVKTENNETLEILLRDELTGLQAILSYTVLCPDVLKDSNAGALARSMRLVNGGSDDLLLTHMASAGFSLPSRNYDVLHLRGAWARERHIVRDPLGEGSVRIQSQRGASSHSENPFIALLAPETTEDAGPVYGLSLLYSGSFLAEAQVSPFESTYVSIGLNPMTHQWHLSPGGSFQCPEAVLTYSSRGLNGMSQVYHALYRDHLCQSEWARRERPILINNWEATYFDFNERKLLQLAETAAGLGIELMVLDDGWFGVRNDDHRSLGDWYVNPVKLPHGLRGIADKVNGLGMKFGLWVEPEMISPDSDLYRAHPDWCLHAPGRSRTEGRHQLILDLSRSEVQDYLIRVLTDVFSSANISYVKWDMNRNMTESFSATLPSHLQMETQHRYILGLYRVLSALTETFPHILFESCSGGGGRFDPGMLYFMPQTWTSDDTDAVERLKIQYGTSIVYPASAMGAHVSAVPNHQIGRVTSMAMRADVAIGGNFGFELDLGRLSKDDLATIRSYVEKLKSLRSLTARGTFTRLISPFGCNYTAWQFADESRVLLCFYRVLAEPNPVPHRVYLKGLDPSALYQPDESDALTLPEAFRGPLTGDALMKAGVPMFWKQNGDFTSRTILFHKLS